jgi:flagellar biosynthesis/type III secretory pathway M-ring protein FliF/YscJ
VEPAAKPSAAREVKAEVSPTPPAIPAETVAQAVRDYLKEHQRVLVEAVSDALKENRALVSDHLRDRPETLSEPIRAYLRDEPSAVAEVVRAYLQEHREVVEHIVWEVVPDLAETLIREEIARLLRDKAS